MATADKLLGLSAVSQSTSELTSERPGISGDVFIRKLIPFAIAVCLIVGRQVSTKLFGWSFLRFLVTAIVFIVLGGLLWLLIDHLIFRSHTRGSIAKMLLYLDPEGQEEVFKRFGVTSPEEKQALLDLARQLSGNSP